MAAAGDGCRGSGDGCRGSGSGGGRGERGSEGWRQRCRWRWRWCHSFRPVHLSAIYPERSLWRNARLTSTASDDNHNCLLNHDYRNVPDPQAHSLHPPHTAQQQHSLLDWLEEISYGSVKSKQTRRQPLSASSCCKIALARQALNCPPRTTQQCKANRKAATIEGKQLLLRVPDSQAHSLHPPQFSFDGIYSNSL